MFNADFYPESAGIYMIRNPKGKIYIGQSTNLKNRIKNYKRQACKDQPLLYFSLKKYGFENHSVEVISTCKVEELNDLERSLIKKYKSNQREHGLNLTTGGQDYFFHSPETRAKMSEAQKGNKKTLGRKQSAEEIQKRVLATTGLKRTEEFRQKRREAMKGKKLPPLAIEKSREKRFSQRKKVVDQASGQVFGSAQEASLFYGIKKTTLVARLNGQNKNNTSLRYL